MHPVHPIFRLSKPLISLIFTNISIQDQFKFIYKEMLLNGELMLSLSYLSFGGQTCHKSSSCISCIVFLNETNSGVDDQQHNNTKKVLPIRCPSLHCSEVLLIYILTKKMNIQILFNSRYPPLHLPRQWP